MAADIKRTLGLKTTLLEGHRGIFEVSLNDKMIYSNHNSCCQEYIPESIIRDLGEAIGAGKLPEKDWYRRSSGG